ncbi:MAG TPA: hemerythrin domain-containing protein [bacterium]
MNRLAWLHDDHELLDATLAHLDLWVTSHMRVPPEDLLPFLDACAVRLTEHIAQEERQFYVPFRASGQADPALIEVLLAEHRDLLESLTVLKALARGGVMPGQESFTTFAEHFLALYRVHTQREHDLLFPLLEQLPPAGAAAVWPITKDATLNATLRRFPELAAVVDALRVNRRWHGSATLEEVAWCYGMRIDQLLDALNEAIPTRS